MARNCLDKVVGLELNAELSLQNKVYKEAPRR